jgi:P pilus assembly chaperone PapD
MNGFKKLIFFVALICCALMTARYAAASGMIPETSAVLIQEEDGETSINVTNSDAVPALLFTSLHDVPEDKEMLLIVTPPVTRVEPGQTQLVRFILQTRQPLKTQRLKRVYFEGIPKKDPLGKGQARLSMTVRQNLPVIITPKNLAKNAEPWKLLKWTIDNQNLSVVNDSPYVVRLAQTIELQPAGTALNLPKTYVLPGEHLTLPANASHATAVRISPATLYGYAAPPYDAPLAQK